MLKLNNQHADIIRKHGESDYPYECCGLLLGSQTGNQKTVNEVYAISNAREESAKRNRFLIEPEELMRGERHARALGLEVVGFYHSHPDHPAQPSQYDQDHAWPVYSYVIVSVQQGMAKELTSWELDHNRTQFHPENLISG